MKRLAVLMLLRIDEVLEAELWRDAASELLTEDIALLRLDEVMMESDVDALIDDVDVVTVWC